MLPLGDLQLRYPELALELLPTTSNGEAGGLRQHPAIESDRMLDTIFMRTTQRLLLGFALLAATAGCDRSVEPPKNTDSVPSPASEAIDPSEEVPSIRAEPRVRSQYAIATITPSRIEVQTSLMGGTGSHLIPAGSAVDALRRDHVASFDISQTEDGAFLKLSTSQPDDRLWFEMESLASLKTIVPSGAGSTYRFHGEVSGFFPDYTFVTDSSDPIVFTLTADTGLKFVSGKERSFSLTGRR